jgi:hypothetical protein
LPFVAAAVADHGPWLSLTVGEQTISQAGARLFQGLGRPWTGLHTIDTIRRDAAAAKIPFATKRLPDGDRVEIVLDGPRVRLVYRVHLTQDWIESIVFKRGNEMIGELTFRYSKLREADGRRPASTSLRDRREQAPAPAGLWLMHLSERLQPR